MWEAWRSVAFYGVESVLEVGSWAAGAAGGDWL